LIALSPEASAQLEALERFYVEKQRPQALRNLSHALAEAGLLIANAPERGMPAPRPYPALAVLGLSWLKRGRYWVAYDPRVPIIAGIFFETDDIPTRVR
jgi:plasmid stabilization system protein ParE